MEKNKVYQGDCIELAKNIPDKSIDLVFCDLPYGETNNIWDTIIPFDQLWETINRVKKENTAICLFAKGKFVGQLMCSNLDAYRYEIIVQKTNPKGHLNAYKMPLKAHENILVFYDKLPTYNPQKTEGHAPVHNYTKHSDNSSNYGSVKNGISGGGNTDRFPLDIITFKWPTYPIHPTEKPVDLCEYIIKTFSNEGDTILDLTTGSGSIPFAAIKTKRNFYAFDSGFCEKGELKGIEWSYIANKRIENYLTGNKIKDVNSLIKEILKNKEQNSVEINLTLKHTIFVDFENNVVFIKPFGKNKNIKRIICNDFSSQNLKKVIKELIKENEKLLIFDLEEK